MLGKYILTSRKLPGTASLASYVSHRVPCFHVRTNRGWLITSFFIYRSLKDLMGAFNSTANRLMEHLSTMADGKTEVCMLDEFARAAIDVICKVRKEQ